MHKELRGIYIFVYVRDMSVSCKFYRDILGLRVIEEDEACVKFDAGEVILALNRAADHGMALANRPDDTSINVFHTYGVEALRAALEKRGLEFSGPTQSMDIGQAAAFYDPDGHCYSLYQPSDMAMKWPSAQKIRTVLHSQPVGVRGNEKIRNADQERAPGEGLSETKLIYLFLFISDVDKSRKFYAETLGLPILEEAPYAGVVKYDAGGLILATHLIDSEEGVRAKRDDLLRPKSIACVFYVKNARECYQTLADKDLRFSAHPKESIIGVTVPFQDPDGHMFYLYEPSEKAMSWPSGKTINQFLETPATATA